MNRLKTLACSFIILLLFTSTLIINHTFLNRNMEEQNQFHVGVAFGGGTTAEAKLLIDRVKNYTNLFVIQSGPVSKNETSLTEIADYATALGLDIIVFFGWFDPDQPWQLPWLDRAVQRYSNQFLGVYYYDEPGGIQLDYDWPHKFDRWKEYFEEISMYNTHALAIEALVNGSLHRDYDLAAKFTSTLTNMTQVFRSYKSGRLQLSLLSTLFTGSLIWKDGMFCLHNLVGMVR